MLENEIVTGFVEEDAYLREFVPEPIKINVVSPRSITLGVSEEVLENTVFTKVKMQNTDFMAYPKKLPRLIFINKEKLLQNPSLAAELSPLVLALSPRGDGPYFTLCHDGINKKLIAIMRDSYLLLALYISNSRRFQPWGTDIIFRTMYYPSPGKLRINAFFCDHLFLFGTKYKLSGSEYYYMNLWEHRSLWSIRDFLEKQLTAWDIEANTELLGEASC